MKSTARRSSNRYALFVKCRLLKGVDDVLGDDAVYCEGDCKGRLHPKCVCMLKLFYDKISKPDDPYYCPNCIVAKQSEEIYQLRNRIKDLE